MSEHIDPKEIITVDQLEKIVDEIYFDFDKGIVRTLCASIVGNRMDFDAVWLMIIAPSSGGKTEMINALNGLPFIYPVSDLTVNTFASGFKKGAGGESSFLLQIQNGIMTIKDYTSILSKSRESREEIQKQMREIYDGEYVKRTGTGDTIAWKGKIGCVAGCTEAIYRHEESGATMGARFIFYNMKQPDRKGMAQRMIDNSHDMGEKRDYIQECFKNVLSNIIEKMEDEEVELDKDFQRKLIDMTDFATLARSGVEVDFKTGEVEFAPKPEMPARFTGQLTAIAAGFVAINKASNAPKTHPCWEGKLTEEEQSLLFKITFDSIARTRRDPIYWMATYKEGVTSAGLAVILNLPTRSVTKNLAKLNALGVCTRVKTGGAQGDSWKINEKYRDVIVEAEQIPKVIEGRLEAEKDDLDDDWEQVDWSSVDDPLAPRL